MGTTRWCPEDWARYVDKTSHKSRSEIFKHNLERDLDPRYIKIRESCDSEANPKSTPIIVAVDQTGSMGFLAEVLIRKGLGVLIEEIYNREPVSDPHIMLMAVGDAWCDRAPLQVTQFESDIRLASQLSKFFIEGGGGGNAYESYNLPWYFAATRTRCDAIKKRGKRGYLFTVGDEPPPPVLKKDHVKKFLGSSSGLQKDMSTRELLELTGRDWDIYHIMIEEGSYFRHSGEKARAAWRDLLGQKAIGLADHKDLAELIVSTISVAEGSDLDSAVRGWSSSTALTIKRALLPYAGRKPAAGGITWFR
ncbi:MAG: hypothetical protein R3C24_02325 [Cyanobacteriota/Melainabacteria group bacterium]|nr:hypothetical protein [Cyanobacteria bacterium HKST-UBA01]MCB9472102.1 hypothetical protein [Candidatus Obscuribacterales bacterium]